MDEEQASRSRRALRRRCVLLPTLLLAGCSPLGQSARVPVGPQYTAARAFLIAKQPEGAGYGLYSYLLFAAPPTPATRDLYRAAVTAYFEYLQPVEQLQAYRSRERLNVTYVPVKEPPPRAVATFEGGATDPAGATAWVLEHYDYARADVLLSTLGGTPHDGPYLVSCLRALSVSDEPGTYLRQDLSGTPPEFVRAWLGEFLRQAATPADWNRTSLSKFVLTLRTAAAVSGSRWPQIVSTVKSRFIVAD